MTTKAKWTVMTYIAAHNNLDQLGEESLREIQNVGSTRDVVHGVLYDGKAGAEKPSPASSHAEPASHTFAMWRQQKNFKTFTKIKELIQQALLASEKCTKSSRDRMPSGFHSTSISSTHENEL